MARGDRGWGDTWCLGAQRSGHAQWPEGTVTGECPVAGGDDGQGDAWWPVGTVTRNAQCLEGMVVRSMKPPLCLPLAAGGGSSAGREQRDNLLLSVDISVVMPRARSCADVLHDVAMRKFGETKAVLCSCPSRSPWQEHPCRCCHRMAQDTAVSGTLWSCAGTVGIT